MFAGFRKPRPNSRGKPGTLSDYFRVNKDGACGDRLAAIHIPQRTADISQLTTDRPSVVKCELSAVTEVRPTDWTASVQKLGEENPAKRSWFC